MSRLKTVVGWEGRYRYHPVSAGARNPLRPGVTVLIPTWNGASLLRRCLTCLEDQALAPTSVLVVDNASTDSTGELVRGYATARIIRLNANTGYSGALSHALPSVDTTYVAVLNNDARPDREWLAAAVRRLEENPDVGCVFPLSMREDGTVDTAGDVISLAGFAYKRFYRRAPTHPGDSGVIVWPSGVAPVYRTLAIRDAGGWDAGLHSQWDDIDLGIRLWQAGWRAILDDTIRVIHSQGASSARRAQMREFLASRNETVVLLKTFSLPLLIRMMPYHALYLITALGARLLGGGVAPFVAGKVAALASLGAVAAARRDTVATRRLDLAALDRRWLRVWFGLSRWGGRRAPSS